VSRAAALARAANAARDLAEALAELARGEEPGSRAERKVPAKARRRPRVRVPAEAPTVVDQVTAKRAEMALRRAGIVTR
jgi:hypothetical protein